MALRERPPAPPPLPIPQRQRQRAQGHPVPQFPQLPSEEDGLESLSHPPSLTDHPPYCVHVQVFTEHCSFNRTICRKRQVYLKRKMPPTAAGCHKLNDECKDECSKNLPHLIPNYPEIEPETAPFKRYYELERCRRQVRSPQRLWDKIRRSNTCVRGIPEGGERAEGGEMFQDRKTDKFPKLKTSNRRSKKPRKYQTEQISPQTHGQTYHIQHAENEREGEHS